MSTTTKLPDHPGDLIRLAVLDLVAAAQDPKYVINMNTWHTPMGGGQCAVCFAGAVMRGTLGVKRTRNTDGTASEFGDDNSDKFDALDWLRTGYIKYAYESLHRDLPTGLSPEIPVTCWEKDRDLFLADMLDLADMIDKAEASNV